MDPSRLYMYFELNINNYLEHPIIAGVLHVGKEVQAIWKNLIDTYRKKSKSGDAGESVQERASQWRYYDRMNFLKTFIGNKK